MWLLQLYLLLRLKSQVLMYINCSWQLLLLVWFLLCWLRLFLPLSVIMQRLAERILITGVALVFSVMLRDR